MNKELLKEYLSSRYQGWSSFLKNVIFPIFGEDDFEDGYEAELLDSQPERKQLAEATGIRSIKQVGMMYVGVEPLQIFDVTVSDRVMMERNRVNIQRLIRAVMDQFSCAFMLFHYEDDTRWDWRFTYCRKSGNKEESTDSKRYTFLLGPGQSCRTATDNFMALYDKRASLEIKDIEEAFNVEALSKEFFGKYKEEYEKFYEFLINAPTIELKEFEKGATFFESCLPVEVLASRGVDTLRFGPMKPVGLIDSRTGIENYAGYHSGSEKSITLCQTGADGKLLSPQDVANSEYLQELSLHESIHAILSRSTLEAFRRNIYSGTGILERHYNKKTKEKIY